MFSVVLAVVEQLLLNIFCLGKAALFTPLVRESKLLLGLFFVSANWHFWVAGFFNSKCRIYEANREPKELTIVSFLGPRAGLPSLYFSVLRFI